MFRILSKKTFTNFSVRKFPISSTISTSKNFCDNVCCKTQFSSENASDCKKKRDKEKLCSTKIDEEVLNLDCKTAVITGGLGGIGYATVEEILKKKAKVVAIFGDDVCKGMEVCHRLNCRFGKRKAAFYKVDVNSTSDIDCAICRVNQEFGKIDVFVNTFGICDGKNWDKELTTNLIGMARMTILAHENLADSKNGGVILNVAGIFGLLPSAGCPTTSAAQHGIIGLSTSFGKDLLYDQTNVRVITLCPGITKTKLFRDAEKRALTPFMGKCLREQIGSMKKQRAEVCGETIVWLLRHAKTGTLWLVDDNQLFKLKVETAIPPYCAEFHHAFTA